MTNWSISSTNTFHILHRTVQYFGNSLDTNARGSEVYESSVNRVSIGSDNGLSPIQHQAIF